ncbi:hypothetical protein BH24ACT3_BH24ACT3_00880 [soil metagenome]
MVLSGPQSTSIVERIVARQIGPAGRELVATAARL